MSITQHITVFVGLLLATLLSACDKSPAPSAPVDHDHVINETISTAVAHPDRPELDKQRDAIRKPTEVLGFFGVRPGMKVLEVMAGGGYYTELLARVAGPQGQVYSQNNQTYYDYQSDKLVNQRLAKQRLANVIRWDKELSDLQIPANQLDGIFLMLVYHDLFWLEKDPQTILHKFYQTLKPGGFIAVVDHAAREGSRDEAAKDSNGIHRIDETFVKQNFSQAGFVLEQTADILRNPKDDRTKAFFDPSLAHQPTDRFILLYRKPRE